MNVNVNIYIYVLVYVSMYVSMHYQQCNDEAKKYGLQMQNRSIQISPPQ